MARALEYDFTRTAAGAYLAGTTVPANWTPFIPVRDQNGVSEIRLQRARMAGGVPPLGRVLREPKSPYFVNEEEIPRTGVQVTRRWQRARWPSRLAHPLGDIEEPVPTSL
jgi:hypothetical protein